MLEDGWAPTAEEAAEVGLVDKVVDPEVLIDEAVAVADALVTAKAAKRHAGRCPRGFAWRSTRRCTR